ncbi:hypothetical protein ABH897_002308 [Paenibacillus sp. RC73]|uniref:hypothetical protein n=1 Tax=Paenibacillus sp. RC73 TaxID=3156250 RepID=UPI0038383A3E
MEAIDNFQTRAHDLQPHKVRYYLERRDPDFDVKCAEVLCVYQQVEYILENEELKPLCDVYLSYSGDWQYR